MASESSVASTGITAQVMNIDTDSVQSNQSLAEGVDKSPDNNPRRQNAALDISEMKQPTRVLNHPMYSQHLPYTFSTCDKIFLKRVP